MKYRKKPVIVEAVKYEGGLIRESKYPKWFLEAVNKRVISTGVDITGDIKDAFPPKLIHFLKIETLEGTMRANKGDYVIKGVNGEIYPCKPDIFEKTYEKVMEENS